VKALREEGYREIVVTGIEISSYGSDFKDGTSLIDLLELIAREGVTRDYAEARIDAQKPNEWFVQNCSHVLDNGGTLADFQRRCHQLIQEVLS
jgi:tRNA A37 methylthiotransferase MiaB